MKHLLWHVLGLTLIGGASAGVTIFLMTAISQPKAVLRQQTTIEPRSQIVGQLQRSRRLIVSTTPVEITVPAQNINRAFNLIEVGRTEVAYAFRGTLQAEINMTDVQPDQVKVEGRTVTITIPPPEIKATLNPTESAILLSKESGIPPKGDLTLQAQKVAEERMQQRICDRDYLRQVDQAGRDGVSGLLSTFQFDQVRVEFTKPVGSECQSASTDATG